MLEIYNRMDARSHVTHDGKKFKKSDILSENRKLLFEGVGHLLSPALVPHSSGGKGNRSPAPSLLVNILVLSDVVIFLQVRLLSLFNTIRPSKNSQSFSM